MIGMICALAVIIALISAFLAWEAREDNRLTQHQMSLLLGIMIKEEVMSKQEQEQWDGPKPLYIEMKS